MTVDGVPSKPAAKLRSGVPIQVRVPPPRPAGLVPEPRTLEVIFEDPDMVVVAKPAGVPVHPGAGHDTGTLVHALLAHCDDLSGIGGVERPGIVHRLDKDTSGVLVVAKNDFAHERIASQFALRSTEKTYRALVLGRPEPDTGRLETLIGRHPTQRKRFSARVSRGKNAISSYSVV
ncbi:MAG: RluA family pseudouridine synthase, partial [Myxococcota bacterium]